jgi:hypothetical protein
MSSRFYDHDRIAALLAPVDRAFAASEAKWGVARLERLVGSDTLTSYRRGWTAYRKAIEDCDAKAVEAIAPKMTAALAFMDREATAAGHQPLAVDVWETPMADGTVLAIVRTMPEAHAVAKDAAGRQRLVYSLEEIARIIQHYEITNAIKLAFPGAAVTKAPTEGAKVTSGVQMSSGELADWVRRDPVAEVVR